MDEPGRVTPPFMAPVLAFVLLAACALPGQRPASVPTVPGATPVQATSAATVASSLPPATETRVSVGITATPTIPAPTAAAPATATVPPPVVPLTTPTATAQVVAVVPTARQPLSAPSVPVASAATTIGASSPTGGTVTPPRAVTAPGTVLTATVAAPTLPTITSMPAPSGVPGGALTPAGPLAIARFYPTEVQGGTRSVVLIETTGEVPGGPVTAQTGQATVLWARQVAPRTLAVGVDVAPGVNGAVVLRVTAGGSTVTASIRMVASTFIGTGSGNPDDVVVGDDGAIYTSDFGNQGINVITPDGLRRVLVTGIKEPEGVALERSGSIIIADQQRNAVLRFDRSTGQLSTVIVIPNRTGADGVDGIALDPTTGDILFPDSPNGRLLRISPDGRNVVELPGRYVRPTGVARESSGNYIVADEYGGRVYRVTPGGQITVIGGVFHTPDDVVLDRAGNIIVNSLGDGTIKMIPAGGGATVTLLTGLLNPHGVAVDPADNLVVIDSDRNRILHVVRTFAVQASPYTPGAGLVPLALSRASGFTAPVVWSVVSAPAGLVATVSADPATPDLAMLKMTGAGNGNGTVVVRAESGGLRSDRWVPVP